MTASQIRLVLDRPNDAFQPGDELTGQFIATGSPTLVARAVEVSVLWYTAGKGDEDMAVHHFERLIDEPPARPLDLTVPHTFSTRLPLSPLSYDGEIVKVCWCARVRVFLVSGPTVVAEAPFRLGDIPTPVGPRGSGR